MPSTLVAEIVKKHYADWLAEPAKSGKTHADIKFRTLQYFYKGKVDLAPKGWMDKYLEKWDQLD